MNYLISFLLCLLCSGCGVKQQPIIRHEKFQEKEIIAKYAELPDTPFQVVLDSIATIPYESDQIQMFYTTTMKNQELIDFYQQQMERLGWDLLAESHAQDCLLHYVKPTQICSILISQQRLHIYLSNKKGA